MIPLFFEDPDFRNFEPLSLSHPVYTLLCGTSKLYQKWVEALKPDDYGFLARPYLVDMVILETGIKANAIPDSDFLVINGRFLPSPELISRLRDLKAGEMLICDDLLLALRCDSNFANKAGEAILHLHTADGVEKLKSVSRVTHVEARHLDYIWDFIELNPRMIDEEFPRFGANPLKAADKLPHSALIKSESVFIDKSVAVGPSVVIDASDGPVIIETNTVIEPFSFIQGPCYIGPGCRVVGGRIRSGCSLGPVCRVGGEVEESILLGYCNKYHEGFLGHAYLGEWVNLGALTTNSDLKNNYKEITVELAGKPVDSGSIKVGCFIGDHTKTGIGTMLNTGINIGFSCNLYGAALFADKSIPSFSWGTPGSLVEYKLDKAVETAFISMGRRGMEFTAAHEKLFGDIKRLT